MATRRHLRALTADMSTTVPPDLRALTLTVPEDTALPGALCRQVDPEVFFPHPDDTETTAIAKTICGYCPAQGACLAGALARNERIGIFGGTTPAERDALLGRTNNCGTPAGADRHRHYGEPPCTPCRKAKNSRLLATARARKERKAAA